MSSQNIPISTTPHVESLPDPLVVPPVDASANDSVIGDRSNSVRSSSTRTSSTVKARKAAAEAAYKRRQYERSKLLAEAAETERRRLAEAAEAERRRLAEAAEAERRRLDQELAQVEEAEFHAEVLQLEDEGSVRSGRSSRMSRIQQWVKDVPTNILRNVDNEPEVSRPGQSAVPPPLPPPAAANLSAAYLSCPKMSQHVLLTPGLASDPPPPSPVGPPYNIVPQTPGLPACPPQPSLVGSGKLCTPPIESPVSPLLLQVIADTAAAAKALATQNKQPKTVPKIELCTYSGGASQWLQFKRLYDSTKPYFSPVENVARLHNALRGHAREAVASLLISAEDPEEIMHALERSFACPEMIVIGEVQELRSLPRLSNELKELGTIANKVRNCLSTMKLLNQSEYVHSPALFLSVLSKLNATMRMRWTDFATDYDFLSCPCSKLEVLSKFLTREHERHIKFGLTTELSLATQHSQSAPTIPHNPFKPLRRENVHSVTVTKKQSVTKSECAYCKKGHGIKSCESFKTLSVDDRWRWLRENRVCYKCLRRNSHQWKSCRVNPCGVDGCSLRHHPLLHGRQDALTSTQAPDTHLFNNTVCAAASPGDVLPTSSSAAATEEKVVISNTGLQHEETSETSVECSTLLKVVPITVYGPAGSYDTYALLDDGSSATIIDLSVATRVGLTGPEKQIVVEGVGGLQKQTKVALVDFRIRGKHMPDIYSVRGARAMQSLNLHTQTISKEKLASYGHLAELTDVLCYTNATPTVLIGAQHWHLSITRGVRSGKCNEPVACYTSLGWTVYGEISSKTKPTEFVHHCLLVGSNESVENENLEILIKEQYKLDSLGICKRDTLHSEQDLRAIEILDSTTKRLPSGRYEVGLPWRHGIHDIPDSYPQALSRFHSLERQMLRDSDFADAYKRFLDNMIEKGYAEKCNPDTFYGYNCSEFSKAFPNDPDCSTDYIRLYLPHFGVFHPQKKKIRVVHDAAARNQGVSLNSLLLPGPDLLENLIGILFRFREGRIAMTADIKEMFSQVRIREQDRDALRFLWRDIKSRDTEAIAEYRMTSVIFGASSSPFMALYIKNRNSESYRSLYPNAANAIIRDHYMDDYLGSVDDVSVAAQLASDIVKVHAAGGFEMRGWISNNNEALRLVPDELRAVASDDVQLGKTSSNVKVLGVSWDPSSDTLGFRTGLENSVFNGVLNKRRVLSHLMKVYDPLGLLGPIVVKGRIMLQETWRSKIDWDTPFPPAAVAMWTEWFKQLSDVSTIKIPRWYAKEGGEPIQRELHVFADASELAYACVAYWRLLYTDGASKLALIGSKARVSPLKPTSIPRLELQAALIASRLAVTIKESHDKKPVRTFLWTDSRTVLGWLRSDARSFKPFVAHRIGEITENSSVNDWRWVPTSLNVADDATRINTSHLNSNHRWFTGPSFLLDSHENWPVEPEERLAIVREERKQSSLAIPVNLVVTADFNRCSDWLRLLRATARVIEFAAKLLRRIRNSHTGIISDGRVPSSSASTTLPPLSAELVNAAERHVLQRVQEECFREEVHCVKNSIPIPKTSRLIKLSPSMGTDGLLRLAGRIRAVIDVDTDVRFPVLLDGSHPIVRMLVTYFHRRAGHANNEMVINEIRQKYWILRLRNTVRSVAKECLICRIRKSKPLNPMTGDLPPQRLAHHKRPFTFTGVDYFGPLSVTIGRRREKRWVALYTCMTSRAVHLELVHTLSADSAIMSLRRFIARRGNPVTIYSDNGTCFVGANRLLKEFYQPEVQDFAANKGIKWSFIPAAAPSFGGCWERLVRSIKVALGFTLRERAPKEEVLTTLLLEAEAIVNSRPLSHVSVESEDDETLTPFHFLIGSSSNQTLPTTLDDGDLVRRSNWKKALRLSDHFWKRWVREILPVMQPRLNNSRQRNLEIGDLVILVDDSLPRGTWPRGRVTTLHPGKDGVVRVVDVATAGGLLRRASRKLIRLDVAVGSD